MTELYLAKNLNKDNHMKKTLLLFSAALIVFACATKKSAAPSVAVDNSAAELDAARKKYPFASTASIQKGRELYFGPCTGCHSAKDPARFSDEQLPHIIKDMVGRAKLAPTDEEALLHYVSAIKGTSASK
jgi:hypothetical protein